MKATVIKIFDCQGDETGAIISANVGTTISAERKQVIEDRIIHYAHSNLYPREVLSISSNIFMDTSSVTIIRGIHHLPVKEIDI